MKNPLPKFVFFIFILVFLAASAYAIKTIPELLEKRSLTIPPPYKKLANTQAMVSTESGKVKYPHDYTLVLLGDSMTESLGNSDELKGYLNEYAPSKSFEVLNYGYGATNILSAKERIIQTTHYGGRDYRPILDIDFDYILIESFGHNPLSQFLIDEGLQKQNEALYDLTGLIATSSGKEKIIFIGTIGTNKKTYAKTTTDLDKETRETWAKERDAYIKNHMEYARTHDIPYIDIFTPSLDSSGNTKGYLIREDDYIHPSPKGLLFISKKIADFLIQNNFIK